jgi:hypothetical protein
MNNLNSKKGYQGFVHKYPILGDTKLVRVPVSVHQKIKIILTLLNSVGYNKDMATVDKVLDKIIEGLHQMHE